MTEAEQELIDEMVKSAAFLSPTALREVVRTLEQSRLQKEHYQRPKAVAKLD